MLARRVVEWPLGVQVHATLSRLARALLERLVLLAFFGCHWEIGYVLDILFRP